MPTVPPLVERLKDQDFEQRRRAADALGDLGPKAAAAVPALVAAFADEHVEVHWYALDALGRIGRRRGYGRARVEQRADQSAATNRYSRRVAARASAGLGRPPRQRCRP